ncbi:MAG: hypothetical protein AAF736_11985 [Pseudomonadota bacterium]
MSRATVIQPGRTCSLSLLLGLLRADARSIARDSLLRWTLLLCVGVFLPMLRWLPPWLNEWLLANYQFDLSPWYPLIQSTCLLIAPVMVGIIGGLMILDQRDDGVVDAMAVTPLGLKGFLAYRLLLPAVVALLITLLMLGLVNLAPITPGAVVLTSLCAAPLAPLLALAIALLASNKIQGFAIAKANGLLTTPVIVAWFIEPPAQWAFALLPIYLPVKLCWLSMAGHSWLWLVPISLLGHGLLITWLYRRLV